MKPKPLNRGTRHGWRTNSQQLEKDMFEYSYKRKQQVINQVASDRNPKVYSRIDKPVLETAQEWDLLATCSDLLWADELILGASQFDQVSYLDTLNL
jgi:hypothetical protein